MTPSENLLNELRSTLGKFEIALGAIHDAILWTDTAGVVQWCNTGFDRLVGRPHIEILGAKFSKIIPLETSTIPANLIDIIMQSQKNTSLCYEFKKDGKQLTLEITGAVFDLANHLANHTKSIILVIRDITDYKVAEALIKKKSEELIRSNNELELFAFVASHDLQEPLRKAQLFTDLLQQHLGGACDAKGSQYMSYIVDGTNRMRALIQDLLAYSRAGRELNMVTMDCNELVDDVAATLEETLTKNSVQLVREPLPQLTASPVLMRQVFQNLISNAVKFRRQDHPQIRIFSRQEEDEWILSVTDNGIGIDPKYQTKIFEIFQRLHSVDQYPGTGIGLAICKKIVERHGGRIWVESMAGHGATFSFTLPCLRKA